MKTKYLIIIALLGIVGFDAQAKAQDDFWKAIMQCDMEAAKKAISKGADPKAMYSPSQNALSLTYFCKEVTQFLLDQGVDPNNDGGTALIGAANCYSIEVMKILLAAGTSPNSRSTVYGASGSVDGKTSAVEVVIRQTNCVPCLQMLKEAGADFNEIFKGNQNYVHQLAIYSMTKEQRKSLFTQSKPIMESYGLKVPDWYGNLGDDRNGTAEQMLDILIEAGCDINLASTTPPYAKTKNTKKDELWNSYSPLMLAVGMIHGSAGKHHMAELLVKKGANVTYKTDFFNEDALALAATMDNPKLVKMLVDAGAEIENGTWVLDQELGIYLKGATPLVLSAKFNKLENCKVLLDAGAKITSGAQGVGKTEKGCFYQIKDKSGLYYAIEAGNFEMVDLFTDRFKFWNNNLMEYIQPDQTTKTDWGAYVEIDNTCSKVSGGLRPNAYAMELGNKEMAKYMLKKSL